MQKFLGQIEDGLCPRLVEPFIRETEVLYFVFKGRAFAPSGVIPEVVHTVTERVADPFYSIDMVQREDGATRIVEIGDGQVSDLVDWTPSRFAQLFKS